MRRVMMAVFALAMLTAASLGAARWMQFIYAPPTVDEYLARHARSGAKQVAAGALTFDGHAFQCGRFPAVLNAGLDDYGAAFFGFVLLNPARFDALPLTLKRYAYAHECGHQYVGYNEGEADCYAVRRGQREGWLDAQAMDDICAFISRSKGDAVHAFGVRRCQMMRRCLAHARTGREPL
jgi:hypothetical protein